MSAREFCTITRHRTHTLVVEVVLFGKTWEKMSGKTYQQLRNVWYCCVAGFLCIRSPLLFQSAPSRVLGRTVRLFGIIRGKKEQFRPETHVNYQGFRGIHTHRGEENPAGRVLTDIAGFGFRFRFTHDRPLIDTVDWISRVLWTTGEKRT